MSLKVNIKKRLGNFNLDVAFETERGVFAILGASGCGKSMTGSMLLWGCAPCPPFPRIVSFTVSEEVIKEPRRMPMVPAGMSGQQ